MAWNDAFQRLTRYSETHRCEPPRPPRPLILGGMACGIGDEHRQQWHKTLDWAEANGCAALVAGIRDEDYLFGRPIQMQLFSTRIDPIDVQDGEAKTRPSTDELQRLMNVLCSRWSEIVGERLASCTRPLRLTGAKARRLLVEADASATPPWGGWSHRSRIESERRTFTEFRRAINSAIAPHKVDHIEFIVAP